MRSRTLLLSEPLWLDQVGRPIVGVPHQIELNAFVGRSADAFCYDDSIRFERSGDRLEIVKADADTRTAWRRDGKKFDLLHQYWLYRGVDAVMADPDLLGRVSPAHLEANLQALAKAKGTWLRLQEVYGMAEQVRTDAGSSAAQKPHRRM